MPNNFLYPPTVLNRAVVYDNSFNVLAYGADPTGVANSTTAFSNAHDAAVSGGGFVHIPAGTYIVDALSKTTAPKWIGAGRSLVTLNMGAVTGAGPWLNFVGSIGSQLTLASDALRNTHTIVLSIDTAFVEGDLIIIGATKPWTSDTGRSTEYMGQQVEVLSYDSPTKTITLKEAVVQDYLVANAAQIRKVTPITGVIMKGFTLQNPSPLTGTAIQCRIRYAKDVDVDVRSLYSDSKCLEIFDCFHGRVRQDARYAADDLAASRYGYGVSLYGASSHFDVNILAYRCRHGFTTDSYPGDFGGPNNIRVTGIAAACTSEGMDTHHGGQNIAFIGCLVIGCKGAGFQLRSSQTQIIGGQSINNAIGVRIGWNAPTDCVVRGLTIQYTHRNTTGASPLTSTADSGSAIRLENNAIMPSTTATGTVIEDCNFVNIWCSVLNFRSGSVHDYGVLFRNNRVKGFGVGAVGGETALFRAYNTVSNLQFSGNLIETSAGSCFGFYGTALWGSGCKGWNNSLTSNITLFQDNAIAALVSIWGHNIAGIAVDRNYIPSFSATPAIDAKLGPTWEMLLTANVTSSTIVNATSDQNLRVVLTQDATGGRTFVWPTNVINPPTIRSAANATTVVPLWFDGTNWYPVDGVAGAGGGAPTTATYWTSTSDAGLSAEVAFAALGTGLVKNTTGTGVPTIAVPDTDYPLEYDLPPARHNILAWTYPPWGGMNTLIIQKGIITLCKIPIPKDITVTNILIELTTAGATLTAGQNYCSIFDSSGNKLRDTATQATAWAGTVGMITMALTSTLALTGGLTAWVYAAILCNGTTAPTFRRATTSAELPNVGLAASDGYRFGTVLTGQTAMPATITIANIAKNSYTYWMGLS